MTHIPELEERFWNFVRKDKSGCWIWTGGKANGYGQFTALKRKQVKAHRFSYELLRGPIPVGLVLDHLCRTPACVNPDHLEPVTGDENILRGIGWGAKNAAKTHCKYGHKFTPETTKTSIRHSTGRPRRLCRVCEKKYQHEYYLRKISKP